MGFEHATLGCILLSIILLLPVVYYIFKARKTSDLYVRRIPGIDAIDEAADVLGAVGDVSRVEEDQHEHQQRQQLERTDPQEAQVGRHLRRSSPRRGLAPRRRGRH